ncbi:MAG: MlaD family protein [Vampirovibrionales bacterium]|nr:MlaD family protein [Vampirovibrionales bacterium]
MSLAQEQQKSAFKVGLMAIVSLLVLVGVVFWLRGRSLSGGESHSVWFHDVDSMREGAAVQLMGIRVGFVESVEPVVKDGEYRVNVKFNLQKEGIKIPRGATISIEQAGIVGEKFLEISPPPLLYAHLPWPKNGLPFSEKLPKVHLKTLQGWKSVGQVESVEKARNGMATIAFRVMSAGLKWPEMLEYKINPPTEAGQAWYLSAEPPKGLPLPNYQASKLPYVVIEPMRMRKFLEVQLASAEALRTTNEKVNLLLSDETMTSLTQTVGNLESLSAQAKSFVGHADSLLSAVGPDVDKLVATSNELVDLVSDVSTHINAVIGQPEFRTHILETASSIHQSAESLDVLLSDPALKATLQQAQSATTDLAQVSSLVRTTVETQKLHEKMGNALVELDESVTRMNAILQSLEPVLADEDASVQQTLDNAKETSAELKKFSEKLNKRFLLWRLLF